MSHMMVIFTFVLATMPEFFGAPERVDDPWSVIRLVVLSLAAAGVFGHAVVAIATRVVERRGSWRAARVAEGAADLVRLGAALMSAFFTIELGWPSAVRAVIGDVVVLDELLSVLPVFLVWAWMWWAIAPLQRRLHEALLLRQLDEGSPVYATPTRVEWTGMAVRHQVLFPAVPLGIILAWTECVERAAARWVGFGLENASETQRLAVGGVQLAGVLAVVIVTPRLLRWVLRTTPLGDGELRDRLNELCRRTGVRVRELLVWRTHGTLINGAAVGLWKPLRYILLTDALLERLPREQVEAVTAHEIAHVRRRHMFWLGVIMLSVVVTSGVALDAGLRMLGRAALEWTKDANLLERTIGGPASLGFLIVGLATFGFVSRRFEWQADAFAAAALSENSPTVSPAGAQNLVSALGAVSALNGIPRRRFSWRHGSIESRQRRLFGLIGRPKDALPIDRQVRWIKTAAVVLLVIAIAVGVWLSAPGS